MSIFTAPAAMFKSAHILSQDKKLLALAMVPSLVTFILSIITMVAAFMFGPDLIALVVKEPESGFLSGLWVAFAWIFRIAASLLFVVAMPFLVMLIGFPLASPLAEKLDSKLGGEEIEVKNSISIMIWNTIGIAILGIVGALFFWLLGLIPGLAVITVPFVTFIWTPLLLVFDVIDPTLSRRQMTFRNKLKFFRSNLLTLWVLGALSTLLLSIPVLNLIGLPITMAMGAITVRDIENKSI